MSLPPADPANQQKCAVFGCHKWEFYGCHQHSWREMRLKAPVLKEAIRAEGVVFRLKREQQQQLDLEKPELPRRRDALPEVRQGGKAIDIERLRRGKLADDTP